MLFAAPQGWQAMMREALKLEPRIFRAFGPVAIGIGLLTLHGVHSFTAR